MRNHAQNVVVLSEDTQGRQGRDIGGRVVLGLASASPGCDGTDAGDDVGVA